MNRIAVIRDQVYVCWAMLVFALLTSSVEAAEFKLSTIVTQAEIGEPFDVILETNDSTFDPMRIEKVEFVAEPDLWNVAQPWGVLDRERKISENQTDGWLWRARVQGLDVGEFSLPEAHVYLKPMAGEPKQEVLATTASIVIVGVRDPNDSNLALMGPKPVREVPAGWGWVWVAAAALGGLGLAAWLLMRRMKAKRARRPALPPEPRLPPGPWAVREIERRRELPDCKPGHAKEIDSHASEVLRQYLGERFGIPALDMTTYECIRALESRAIDVALIARVRKFLDECDLVKFSKFEPDPVRWDGIWDDTKQIIEASTPPEEFVEADRLLREWREKVGAMK